jgi:TPR repeat protein
LLKSIDALHNLGNIYESGIGVDKDLKISFKYYKKAAEEVILMIRYK